ncbi:ETX/MTX2 family pore-forming toxin [Spiroplasma sp. AdecLV25b]|uniref:ETX/MTX2 family pore-forming toxin n=1 Tax=Spiroplasma sp. AdecLV25b TaxID=3027162 RepID=UPI0027DFEE17|nr:ETX/MTX2 family pore-forming toxin [Spiroplasma sp. AdecLV25b]
MINKLILFSSITITNGLNFLSSPLKESTHIYNENSVININDYIQGAFAYAEDIKCYSGWKIDKIEDVKLSNLKTTDAVGEAIGDPEIISQDKTFEYVGENILKNYNDLEQNIATMSFTKKIGETVSASIYARN